MHCASELEAEELCILTLDTGTSPRGTSRLLQAACGHPVYSIQTCKNRLYFTPCMMLINERFIYFTEKTYL